MIFLKSFNKKPLLLMRFQKDGIALKICAKNGMQAEH